MAIIQNKFDKISDLVEKADFMKYENLQEYSRKNKFDLCYQTSAKTGENIENAISGFIRHVIDKFEKYLALKNMEVISEEKINNTMMLSNKNNYHNKNATNKFANSCCK